MDDDGWDLQAVVRSCRLTSPPATRVDPFSSFSPGFVKEEPTLGDANLSFPELSTSQSSLQELDELYKPFICEAKPQQIILPSSSSTAVAPPAQLQLRPKPLQRSVSQMSRSKRRRNQQKRVVRHVPADELSADVWAWRKYGQKPIKGSPYPRGYYRCSSSKGCLARKQVERSRTDPGTFIITYTAEHNHPAPAHRNSLAGSSRTMFPSSSSSAATAASDGAAEQQQQSPLPSPPHPVAGLSPNTPLTSSMEEEGEDEEGVLMVEDMEVMGEDDLVFTGLDEISGGSASAAAAVGFEYLEDGGGFDENLFAPPPWLANSISSNAAAAAGGS